MSEKLPEFSRPFDIEKLADCPRTETIEANAEELKALETRLELEALPKLGATVRLARKGALISLSGTFAAQVVQTSVVSLKPVESEISESFEAHFTLENNKIESKDIILDEDMPEILEGGLIDLGEVVSQYLSLALNPYPREKNEGFEPQAFGKEAEIASNSPFSVLNSLKTDT